MAFAIADLVRAQRECPLASEASERPGLVHIGFAKARLSSRVATDLTLYSRDGERVVVQGQFLRVDYSAGVARSQMTPTVLDRVGGRT